jgi:hypothetical protein
MATLYYNRDTDVYEARSINTTSSASYTRSHGSDDGYSQECEMRESYPLLSERFLDGYSDEQVARGHMLSVAQLRIEFDIELYSLRRDVRSFKGPGHVMLVMADRRNEVREVCQNRPV